MIDIPIIGKRPRRCPHGEPRGDRYCALCRNGIPAPDPADDDHQPYDPHAGARLVRNALTRHFREDYPA